MFLLGTLSPLGRFALGLALIVAWTAYQRNDAAHVEKARLTQVFQLATAAEVARQTAASSAAVAAATARAKTAEDRTKELQGIADELDSAVSKAGVSCTIPDSIRKRLLAIH